MPGQRVDTILLSLHLTETSSRERERTRRAIKSMIHKGFPGGSVVENLPANAKDVGLIPGPGGSHICHNY